MKKLLLVLCCFCIYIALNAQYKILKKSITDIGLVNNSANSMAVQQDDKIVAIASIQEGSAYKIGILRYTKSGALDNSFGKNGVDTFSVSKILASYQGISLRSLTIQSDAKIVVAGSAWYTAGVNYLSDVFVMRLLSNGIIDSSFGKNGIVTTNISSSTGLSVDDGYSVKMQDDSKIVVAGQTYDYLQHRFLAIRYNTNGSADNSFGSAGATVFSIGVSDDEAFALAIQSNGKIILAGESYSSGVSYRVAVARLNATGKPDALFGSNGIVTTDIGAGGDEARTIVIQNNTRIVVSGFTASTVNGKRDAVCLRYTNNGTPDSSFGVAGKSIVDVAGNDDVINSLVIQPDNKILMSGYTTASNNISNFLSIRLSANGSKDNTYGSNGISISSVFQQGDVANGSGILSTGKIVLAGQTANGAAKFISLTAYNKTGSVDSTFANDGNVITGIGSSDDIAYKLLRSPWDNSLYVAGIANGYWVLAKYKATTLTLDPSFGLNGTISANYSNPEDPKDEASFAIDAQAKKIYLAGYTGQKLTIVRFTKDGLLDTTFSNKGTANYGLSIFYGAFGIESDHKILLAGVRQESNSGYNFIARLNANGITDSSFGTNGEVRNLPLTPNSIQMKRDGSTILIGGRVPKSFNGALGVMSLNLNGTPDQSFGTNGLVSRYSGNANAQIFFKYNLAQDQLGRILLSGGVQGSNFKYQFSVTRFLKNGVVDSSFANNGLFVKDVSTGSYSDNYNEGISSFCSGNNCSVLTSGIKMSDGDEKSTVVIITLKNDGSIDSLNNINGYIDTTFYNDMYEGSFAALIDTISQSSEIMYIAGKANNGVNSDFLLVKLQKSFSTLNNKPAIAQTDYQLNVSPNPTHNNIHITYNTQQAGEVTITFTSFNGKLIQQQTNFNSAGKQFADMPIPAGILPGYYFIRLTCGKEITVSKILVQ